MTRRGVISLVFVAAVFAVVTPRSAQSSSRAAGETAVVRVAGRPGGAELRVRGRPVARLFGRPATSRLRHAARLLDPLLPPPTAITTRATSRIGHLIVDGQVVLSVTRSDAARAGVRPAGLVSRWAQALEDALAVPPIALSRSNLVLSPGRSAVVSIATAGSAPVALGAFDRRVADVILSHGEAQVLARNPGSTIVPFRFGPYRVHLAVSVRPPAGVIPPDAEVIVTGAPATVDLIREAVERRLGEAVQRNPGASMEVGAILIDAPLDPGGSVTIPVPVAIRSPYAGPVDGIVRLQVTNRPIQIEDPDVLLISNRPETITGNGLLFQETLAPGRPARLLYHHLNGTPPQARLLKITLANPGGARARVHYLSGLAGPSPDPIFIGFASTARFLDALISGRGYIVEVPPNGAAVFTAYTLAPMALVSGLMQFQVTEGGPIDLIVHVRLPWLLDRTVTRDLGQLAFPHPRGTFPGAVVEVAREQPAHLHGSIADLGVMSNLQDVRTGEALVGDYGVLYRLRLRLTNPTGREVATALVANAAGGLARGLFIINGAPVDVGLMRATEDREVAVFTVAPGSALEIAILTMPVAGSFYPVRLSLRPR
ncbi:MAG: hypothetical protein ACT4P5_05210 [Armatimonadota bacterium]